MYVTEPDSIINICSVPMKMGNPNQLIFENETKQKQYFNNLSSKRTFEGCSYVRKDGTLRVPVNIEVIRRDNYVFYQNPNYHNRIFYNFIESMEYANDNMTFVKLRLDPWQTYQFDIRYRTVFVERETTASDNVGEHTFPEGLELGEIVTNGGIHRHRIVQPSTAMTVVAVSDITPLTRPWDPAISGDHLNFYNGVYSGLTYIAFNPLDGDSINKFLAHYADASHGSSSDAIKHMFVVPKQMINSMLVEDTASVSGATIYWVRGDQNGYEFDSIVLTKPSQIDGYTPKNKKLLTFPYCFFNVSNNGGTIAEYHYEDFSGTPTFDIEGTCSVGCSIKAHPRNYKNASDPYSYGVVGAKLPTCGWTTDVYTNWLTQNALNIENVQVFGGLSAIGSAIGTGHLTRGMDGNTGITVNPTGIAGTAVSYANIISSQASEQYQHSVQPPQANGDSCAGDITFAHGQCAFTFYPMCVRAEVGRKIDEYFDINGYKVNRVKKPQLFSRKYWNFIKTVGCLLEGRVPNDALDALCQMFDNGITFWHDPSEFGNYNLTNSIVS